MFIAINAYIKKNSDTRLNFIPLGTKTNIQTKNSNEKNKLRPKLAEGKK